MIFLAAASLSQQGGIRMIGGNEYDAGGYHVHEFVSTGTLQVLRSTQVEYLVLGGGAGASGPYSSTHAGAGGGAGELKESTSLVIPKSNQTVTVGSGGNGGSNGNLAVSDSTNGGASSLGSLVTCLGGGTGGYRAGSGSNGGCGGGGGNTPASTKGLAVGSGYGFDGSAGFSYEAAWSPDGINTYYQFVYRGGSGGGTASAGSSFNVPGTARTSDITGTTESYGKGGAGGSMGSSTAVGAMDSTANRGGGGGGAYIMGWPYGGGGSSLDGIDGVVIVRYPI